MCLTEHEHLLWQSFSAVGLGHAPRALLDDDDYEELRHGVRGRVGHARDKQGKGRRWQLRRAGPDLARFLLADTLVGQDDAPADLSKNGWKTGLCLLADFNNVRGRSDH